MFTECPTCNTVFRVLPAQLQVAGGKVRCGECLAVFDAREYLREDLEEPPESTPPPPAEEHGDATLPLELPPPAAETAPLPPAMAAEPAMEQEPQVEPDDIPRPEPIPVEPSLPHGFDTLVLPPENPRPRGRWFVASVLLLLLLLGQYLWFNRNALVEIPALRPVVEALCTLPGCELAPRNDPTAFELTGRAVQSHPSYAGALVIDATFINRSDLPRPYPVLELLFTDPEGEPLASRRFLPQEYLGQAPQELLAPGAEAHVALEVLDPGDLAVGYEFRFL